MDWVRLGSKVWTARHHLIRLYANFLLAFVVTLRGIRGFTESSHAYDVAPDLLYEVVQLINIIVRREWVRTPD